MARPLVLIHGYSAEGKDFENLKQALVARGIESKDIDICNYISLNNEITIKDIAEGLEQQNYHIERRKIYLEEPIKQLGEFQVPIRLHREVTVEITVRVIPEE